MDRLPVLAEITNLTVDEAMMHFAGMEGIKAQSNGKIYAIIGWVYNDSIVQEYW